MAKRVRLEDWLKEENLIRVQGWARDGLTMEQIAHNIGITKPTLYKWQERDSNFLNALKVSRDSADRQVGLKTVNRKFGEKNKISNTPVV